MSQSSNESQTSSSKNQNNKDRIIQAAMHLIGKKGVEGTSLADIANYVGISKGTLYYYYSSKNDLIFDITEVHMNRVTTDFFALIEKNVGEVSWSEMLVIVLKMLLQSDERSRLHLYLVREAVSGNDDLKKRFQTTYSQWFKLVQEAYQKITDENRNIEVEAKILVATIDGFIIQKMLSVEKNTEEEIVQKISRIIS